MAKLSGSSLPDGPLVLREEMRLGDAAKLLNRLGRELTNVGWGIP